MTARSTTRRAARAARAGADGVGAASRGGLSTGVFVTTVAALVGLLALVSPSILTWYSEQQHAEAVSQNSRTVTAAGDTDLQERLGRAQVANSQMSEILVADPYSAASAAQADDDAGTAGPLLLPGSDVLAQLHVPGIGLTLPVYEGVEENALSRGAGLLPGTSLPVGGAGTHSVIGGHSGRLEADYLTRLDELRAGDVFTIEVLGEQLVYEVTDIAVVDPSDISGLRLEAGRDLVTLLTCTPRGQNTHRLLVTGERVAPEREAEVITAEASLDRTSEGVRTSFPWWILPLVGGGGAILLFARPRKAGKAG